MSVDEFTPVIGIGKAKDKKAAQEAIMIERIEHKIYMSHEEELVAVAAERKKKFGL